jgi:RHS repeat-associated protein
MENPSETFYYHADPLGTITDLTDEDGDAQWRYTYEAYGAQLSAANVSGTAPDNRLRFAGQYFDAETALYHLRARQYEPALGRFHGVDPVEVSVDDPYVSSYGYVSGRPLVYIDPSGRQQLGGATRAEIDWCIDHPTAVVQCGLVGLLAKEVLDLAADLFPLDLELRDSFQHCAWSAAITVFLGARDAYEFTRRHEEGAEHCPAERQRDLANNAYGILIGIMSDANGPYQGGGLRQAIEMCYRATILGHLVGPKCGS